MKIALRRIALLPLLAVAVACPGDKKNNTAQLPVDTAKPDTTKALATTTDTTTTDLSKIKSNLPTAAPDTFHRRNPAAVNGGGVGNSGRTSFADAPRPLVDAVEREQSATRFCYTEFGQKADPTLRGNVAMVVTIGSTGVTNATVGDSKWSGTAGRAVNRCLDQKAKQAWNVAPGAVKPGHYVVQLSFSGTR
ncbi:MAG TPA: hypothetical protein VGH98_23860 [Gemmatimonadaceae bacterium]|jgi:hypothetical protein